MKWSLRTILGGVACVAALCLLASVQAAPTPQGAGPKFEVSFPASLHAGSITGRVFVAISTKDKPEPRLLAGSWWESGSLYGADVEGLRPDQAGVIDTGTFGVPMHSLRDIPAGDYYVQAI